MLVVGSKQLGRWRDCKIGGVNTAQQVQSVKPNHLAGPHAQHDASGGACIFPHVRVYLQEPRAQKRRENAAR
jgi:hypothetical protein